MVKTALFWRSKLVSPLLYKCTLKNWSAALTDGAQANVDICPSSMIPPFLTFHSEPQRKKIGALKYFTWTLSLKTFCCFRRYTNYNHISRNKKIHRNVCVIVPSTFWFLRKRTQSSGIVRRDSASFNKKRMKMNGCIGCMLLALK